MERLLKHKLLIGLVTVLAAISAGVAYAATQSGSTSQQALINDVAKRLNVSPARLRAAVKGALLDRLQAAVKAGELTQAQANKIKQRIESGALPIGPLGFERRGFGPPGFMLPGFARPGPPGLGPMGYGPPPGAKRLFVPVPGHGPFAAAAKYLGISETQLLKDLRGGKSLAQVAKASGKSVSGLEQALTHSLKTRLDRAVAAGFITKAQEQRMLTRLSAAMAGLANGRGFQIQRAPVKPWPGPGPAGMPVPGPAAVPMPGPAGAGIPGPAVAPGPPGVPPPSA